MKKKMPNTELRSDTLLINETPTRQYRPRDYRKYDLENRLLEFAVQVIDFTEALPNTRAGNHVAGQLMRSWTSPNGNHGEVESAESRKDFIHKLKVCLKELRETRRWLRLAARLKGSPQPTNLAECINEADELIRIFVASIRTAERNEK